MAIRRKAGVREFTDEFVSSEPVQRMMTRVTTVFDATIEAQGFDKIRSVVEVDLTDGRRFVQASDDRYRGGPDRPFTREELRREVHRLRAADTRCRLHYAGHRSHRGA